MPEDVSEKVSESDNVTNGNSEVEDAAHEVKKSKVVEKLKRKKSVKARKSEAHKPNETASVESPKTQSSAPRPQPASPIALTRSPAAANGVAKQSDESVKKSDDALREGLATALFDYDPQENDELAFSEGAVLEVLEVQDDGWVTARDANGATGLVPGNYLKMLRTVITKCDGEDTEVMLLYFASPVATTAQTPVGSAGRGSGGGRRARRAQAAAARGTIPHPGAGREGPGRP